ncbi:hypothetical protein [Helicobacter sp. 11S02629-2]|uniref:hypothetical protein n=1 Tax=Helicobacter sp. 11S02629-2 TaxID=1476195 RepID=UPI000BA5174F|nr:hypothetical protein [Helicobacter sp. 11S02629-2]PAF44108.1 hypothetical protein BKH40_06470 [Helicobacter sp. 11S02629-2]
MSEIEGLEKLKKLDIKDIRKATNLTPARIQDVLNKNFEGMERVRAVGFVRILEREFNVDLSEWIKEYDEYHKIEHIKVDDSILTSIPAQSNVLNEYVENQKNLNEAKNFLKEKENLKKQKSFPFTASDTATNSKSKDIESNKITQAKAEEKRAKVDEEKRELITPADFINPSLDSKQKDEIKKDELKEEGIDQKDFKATNFDAIESQLEKEREEKKAQKRAKKDEEEREAITSADFIDPNLSKTQADKIKLSEIVEEGINKHPAKTSTYNTSSKQGFSTDSKNQLASSKTKRSELQGVKLEYSNTRSNDKKVGKVVGIIILIVIIVIIIVIIALFVTFENKKEAKLRNANLQMEHTTNALPSPNMANITQDEKVIDGQASSESQIGTNVNQSTQSASSTLNTTSTQANENSANAVKLTFNSSEPLWIYYVDLDSKVVGERLLKAPFTLDVSHDTAFHFGHTNFELSVNGSNVVLDNPNPSNPARYLFSMKDGFKKISIKEFNKLVSK